jgi:hypothetical protein
MKNIYIIFYTSNIFIKNFTEKYIRFKDRHKIAGF